MTSTIQVPFLFTDFENLQLACKNKTLHLSQLQISKVPISNCVIVRKISKRTSRDTLEFYFDNKNKSGVSGLLDVKMLDGFCLVFYEEPEGKNLLHLSNHFRI